MLSSCGHSRTISIVTVILGSVRYLQFQTGELACQQILFIETCGRENSPLHPQSPQSSADFAHLPSFMTSFCTFAHLLVPTTPSALVLFFRALSHFFPPHPLLSLFFIPALLIFLAVAHRDVYLFERMLQTLWPGKTYKLVKPKSTQIYTCELPGTSLE